MTLGLGLGLKLRTPKPGAAPPPVVPTGWWQSGAALDLDVVNNRAYGPRTNYVWPSLPDTTNWLADHATVTPNAGVAPDSATTASQLAIQAGTTLLDRAVFRAVSSLPAGTVGGMWVKGTAAQQVYVWLDAGGRTNGNLITFTGAWQRVSTPTYSGGSGYLYFSTDHSTAPLAAVTFLAWHTSVEKGATLTEPVLPTTTTAVTVTDENASLSGILSCTRASVGTAESAAGAVSSFPTNTLRITDKGLLVEEQRTNYFQQSQTLNNAYWTNEDADFTADAGAAPDGTTTADKLVERTNNVGTHRFYRLSVGAAGANSFSFYAKAAGRSKIVLFVLDSGNSTNYLLGVDLTNGSTFAGTWDGSNTGVPFTAATARSVGNGWYRIECTATLTAAAHVLVYLTNSTSTTTYTGDGTSGVLFWGMQAEAGAFATSYIPTTTASATRNVDNVVSSGISWLNDRTGTLVADVDGGAGARLGVVAALTKNTGYQDTISLFKLNAALNGAGNEWGVSSVIYPATDDFGIATADGSAALPGKIAVAYAVNDAAFASNGAIVGTDTSVALSAPGTLSELSLMCRRNSGVAETVLSGWMRRLTYFPTRKTNAELVTLTT